MPSIRGVEAMVAELSQDTELFRELDKEVERIIEPLHARVGMTPELFVMAFNEIKSGKAEALEPLHNQRMPKKQETVVSAFKVPTESGHTVLVFETDDGLLWQLCDGGLGWSPYERIDPSWPKAPKFAGLLRQESTPGRKHRLPGLLKSHSAPAQY